MGNNASNYTIITVTPTMNTGVAYAAADVLFNPVEIPNAVRGGAGCSLFRSVSIFNQDDTVLDIDLIFMSVSKDLGTINDVVGSGSKWSNALAEAALICGVVRCDASDGNTDLINNQLWTMSGATGNAANHHLPLMLQANVGSTSVFVAGVLRDGTPTFTAADDIDLILHIQYK